MQSSVKRLALFLLCAIGIFVLNWNSTDASSIPITAVVPEQLAVPTADGTKIQGNTAVTNTKSVDFAPGGDLNGNGIVDEGDVLRYTVTTTNNSGVDLTNVIFTDTIDANTIISGTVHVSPVAVTDNIVVTNGGATNDNVTDNDSGQTPLTVISFGNSPATVGTFPADGVTVGSFPAPGGGTIDATIDANGNLSTTANGTTGSGVVTFYYEIQTGNGLTDIGQIDVTFGDFPTAVDDTLATLGAGNEYSTEVGITLNIAAGIGLLNNDTLGTPAATLTDWGGGDASANVDHSPGTSRPFAGGTLTVQADGSFDLVNPTTPGVYTFDYIIDNGLGSSQATVEIYVNDPPIAEDDAVSATVGQTNIYDAPFLFNDNGSGADYLGVPPASLTGWGNVNGVSGDATEFVPGSTHPLPIAVGGTLTVNADGSFVVDTPTAMGSFTFEYEIDNGVGTDTATVTVIVLTAPNGFDDTDMTVTGGTSEPGDNNFHLAINTAANGVVNAYADNGFGADILGNPPAPTDAPADIIDTVLLNGTPDSGAGIIGGGLFTIGGSGSIEIATAGAISVTPPTDFVGILEFDYTLANSVGTDATPATVTFAFGERPSCSNDSYSATGNIGINTANVSGNDVLQNDEGDQIAVTAVQGSGANIGVNTTTDNGGVVNMTASGEFAYNPPVGFTGNDTFTYAVNNAFNQANTCTVTIEVEGDDLVYFMDSNAPDGGNGSLAAPYRDIDDYAAALPPNNSFLFVADNGTPYAGNLVLRSGLKIIGEGATGSLFGNTSLTGIVLAPLSDNAPDTTGSASDWAQFTNAAGNALTINVNNTMMGVDIGDTSGFGLVDNGLSVGTLTISDTQIVGTGGLMSFTNGGTLAATFTNLTTSSSVAEGLLLQGVGGNLTANTTNISGTGAEGIQIDNAPGRGGTFHFGLLDVTTTNGIGLSGTNNNNQVLSSMNCTFMTTGFAAIDLDHTNLALICDVIQSINTSGDGINLDVVTGSLTAVDAVTVTTTAVSTGNGISIHNSFASTSFGVTNVQHLGTGDAVNLDTNFGRFRMIIGNTTGLTAADGDALQATNHVAQIIIVNNEGGLTATGGGCALINGGIGTTDLNIDVQSCTTTNSPAHGIQLENVTGSGFIIEEATSIDMAGGSEPIRIVNALNIPIDLSDDSTIRVNQRNATGFFVDNHDGGTLNVGSYTESNNAGFVGGYGIRIQNSTSPVNFDQTNVANALTSVAQTQSGGFPTNDGDGDNIFLSNNLAPFSFTTNGGAIDNAQADNIDARNSNSLVLRNVTIEDASAIQVAIYNSPGTHVVSGATFRDFAIIGAPPVDGHGYVLKNNNVNAIVNITDSIFDANPDLATTRGGVGVLIQGFGNSTINPNIAADTLPDLTGANSSGSTVFQNFFGPAVQIDAEGAGSTVNTIINGVTFRNNNPASSSGFGGLNLTANQGFQRANIIGSLFVNLGQSSSGAGIVNLTPGPNGGSMQATFNGNRIDDFQRRAINVPAQGSGLSRFLIANNVMENQTGTSTPVIFVGRAVNAGDVHVEITANTIGGSSVMGSGPGINLTNSGSAGSILARVANNNIGAAGQLAAAGIFSTVDNGNTTQLTMQNNTVNAGSGGSIIQTDLFVEAVTSATHCADISGNLLNGDGILTLTVDEIGAALNVTQESVRALSSANNDAAISELGDPVQYNAGPCTLPAGPYTAVPTATQQDTNATVTASLPKAHLGKPVEPGVISLGETVTATVPVLPTGKTVTFIYDVVVGPLDGVAEISNQAQVSADGMLPMLTNTAVIGNLALDKTAVINSETDTNVVIAYEVTVDNPGSVPFSGVTISDTLPAGASILLNSATAGSYDPGSGEWNVGTVLPNSSETLTLQIELPLAIGDSVTNQAELLGITDLELDSNNNVAVADVTRLHHTFLPIVTKQYINAPDLIVESITTTSDNVEIVVRNVGPAPVTNGFWVDMYVNPAIVPTQPNQLWNIGTDSVGGAVWGLDDINGALPIAPGDSRTLTLGGAYYFGGSSDLTAVTGGETIYVQVDSYGSGPQLIGNVPETHELTGQAYNNIAGPETLPPVFNPPTEAVNSWQR